MLLSEGIAVLFIYLGSIVRGFLNEWIVVDLVLSCILSVVAIGLVVNVIIGKLTIIGKLMAMGYFVDNVLLLYEVVVYN